MQETTWERLRPEITSGGPGEALLLSTARELALVDPRAEDGVARVQQVRRSNLKRTLECGEEAQIVRVSLSVLSDLRAQGWGLQVAKGAIEIEVPVEADDPMEEKARIRAGLLVERDQQLREPAVRRFIAQMERRRRGPSGWLSIFSLMRDGNELAEQFREAGSTPDGEQRLSALKRTIQPYIQLVDDSACGHTGLLLKDIWRYFRHTWASPHKSLPGRTIWFLVRDAAAANHPVIGIAALGSAVVQLRIRDEWIGWTNEQFLERLQVEPSDRWAVWIATRLEQQLDGIYVEDLRERGVLTAGDVELPTPKVIQHLRELAAEARETHRLYGSSREHKRFDLDGASIDWEARARTHLFASKRSATLADLLEDKLNLQSAGFTDLTGNCLRDVLRTVHGRKGIARILRRVKAAHVGIDMLDITVCGAIPPYSHILGGKLVSLLLASPEVRHAYEDRYADRASVIASSMAGRAIRRAPQLVLLGTTSLYGVGSSQYNRLHMPACEAGGSPGTEIRYIEQGVTEGYGSFHFSAETLEEIRMLLAQTGNGRRVKHIFGEGANPRMREVREALDQIGLPSDRLLRHGSARLVYAVPLATNFRDVLLECGVDAEYIIPSDDLPRRTQNLVDFWIRRWLAGRIMNEQVLREVEQHTLSYPVDHGARVKLPGTYEETPLFPPISEE